jgi:hypothetical protein
MKLVIKFDEAKMRAYYSRGSSVVFRIYWQNEDADYPMAEWQDFGADILSWWIVSTLSLSKGASEAEFMFMDGPYSLRIKNQNQLLTIIDRDDELRWNVSLKTVVEELISAAQLVVVKLQKLGIPDRTGLAIGEKDLRDLNR